MSIFSRMYGSGIRHTYDEPKKQPTVPKEDPAKSAVRSLSGMKVHGSHMAQVEIGNEIVDIPRIEYVDLLDKQLKDARERVKKLEYEVSKLQKSYIKLSAKVRDLH